VTILNYSAIADLQTLQITTAHAKSFQSAVSSPRSLVTASNSGDSSASAITSLPASSQLNRLSLLFTDALTTLSEFVLQLSSLKHLGTDRVGNNVHYYTPIVSVGTRLFAKALRSNGCVYLLIKNLLPSRGCCFVVCFEVVTQ
jgi:hypothetical protein